MTMTSIILLALCAILAGFNAYLFMQYLGLCKENVKLSDDIKLAETMNERLFEQCKRQAQELKALRDKRPLEIVH